jgi:hypothetical protein
MGTPVSATIDPAQIAIMQKKLALNNRIRSGASWFFWIAGLSLLNTLLFLAKTEITFVVGLGITQFVDGVMSVIAKEFGDAAIAIVILQIFIDVIFAGFYLFLGIMARKQKRWAFITGMIIYIIDALIVLLCKDYLAAIFHVLALAGIIGGLAAMKNLRSLEKTIRPLPETNFNQEPPTFTGTLN